jgi:hypothetical protein
VRHGAQEEIVGVETFRMLPQSALDFGPSDARFDYADDALGDLVLKVEGLPAPTERLWQDERRPNSDRRSGNDRRKPPSPRKAIKWYHVGLASIALCWADLNYRDGEHSLQVLQGVAYELNARLAELVGVAFVRR